jgi:putative oxidoreductase
MLYHGWHKVVPATLGQPFAPLQHNARFVAGLGMPAWLGYISALTEFLGGIGLILGLFTRLFAFLVSINMFVAIFAATIHRGYAGSELSIELLVMAIMLLVSDPGRAALDRKLRLA